MMTSNLKYKYFAFAMIRKRSKFIAAFFAINMLLEILVPMKAWALTGGPSQPESSSFEPVNTTEMVDLFSGDFNYNIPLFDVGGYPINISYHGGITMDQEASWVGLGWNINPGAINRGMRGLPDDFLKEDIKKEMHTKKNVTWALKLNTDLEIFGNWGKEKRNGMDKKIGNEGGGYHQAKHMNKLSKTQIGLGVVYNNYKGLGYSLDFSTDITKSTYMSEDAYNKRRIENAEAGNFGKKVEVAEKVGKLKGNVSFGLNSQDGSTLGGGLSYSIKIKEDESKAKSIVPSVGLGYNSFLGSKSLDVGLSYTKDMAIVNSKTGSRSSSHSLFGVGSYLPIGIYSFMPSITMSTLSTSNSFNATVGFDAFGGHPDMRLSGFYNTEEIENESTHSRAYGYLYEHTILSDRGNGGVVMDFNREKETAVNKNLSHLPLTNHTYDIYSVSGQGTGGMYRPHRVTLGVLNDGFARNKNKTAGMNDLGIELGFGSNFRVGINYKNKSQKSSTGLWGNSTNGTPSDNELLEYMRYNLQPEDNTNYQRYKHFYFKSAGEQTPSDNSIASSWGGKNEVSLKIEKTGGTHRNLRFGKVKATLNEKPGSQIMGTSSEIAIRSNVISYLTAEEASHSGIGLDPFIISYPQNYWTNYIKNNLTPPISHKSRYNKVTGERAHHISEVISNSGDGMRYVYGLPAYNNLQKEVMFAVSKDMNANKSNTISRSDRTEIPEKGLVTYKPDQYDNSISNERGVDHYFNASYMPEYAHSYLLTGVLSPDYADLTGDGITDDDYGSAVKFNYYKTPGQYNWRTPYEENSANLDQGFLSDNSDNKGSYVFGKKEQWYLQSMESKTHIAEFKLSKRNDGRGVAGENGGLSTLDSNSSMKLDSIVIYSKLDLLTNGKNAIPVKTIVFQYDYTLCPGIPNNSISGEGKLTLRSIYFTYGNSGKGALNPYQFNYSNYNPPYSHVHYDRWGNYKKADENLPNRFFPYDDYLTSRDTMNSYASAWNLNSIELPSGGKINIEYEADDYAYVQDRRAMSMMKVVGATSTKREDFSLPAEFNSGNNVNIPRAAKLYDQGKDNNYIYFKLKESPSEITGDKRQFLVDRYLKNENGELMNYIYYRFKVNMDPRNGYSNNFEYVSGYAEIDWTACGITDNSSYGYVKLKEVRQGDVGLTKCNPIAKQAWQLGLQHLRKVMYPGSDLSQADEDGNRVSAIKGLKNAFTTSLNLFTGPYQNLRWKHIAQNFETNRSYIRLCTSNGFKVGGGNRVKRITINDNWNAMDNSQSSGEYGQEFTYTTKTKLESNSGELISSGVASYEPFIGNDENPFRRPVFYHTNRFLFPNLNEYQEEPFGESFFPSASVGYSRVVVRNIPKPGTIVTSTGKVVHEFYTAKDFPVIIKNTPLKFITNGGVNATNSSKDHKGKTWKKFTKALKGLFNFVKRDYMVASQGYSIVLNDMHGKPKSTAIYSSDDEELNDKNFTGRLLSGTEFKYKTESSINPTSFKNVFDRSESERFKPIPKGANLNNTVWVMKETGELVQREIATAYDIAVDTRESKSNFTHAGLDWNLENFMIYAIPCPYPKYLVTQNLYQGAVVTKVIQQYGVLEETVAYDHSSIVKTKNLVWDEQTGQVLLTATTNEFDDPLYNYSYPAHLIYDGMGPSYKNIDYETSLLVKGSGEIDLSILGTEAMDRFYPGDELLMTKDGITDKAWVLKAEKDNAATSGYKEVQIIDAYGQPFSKGTWNARVIRSGRRNIGAPVGAITTMSRNVFEVGQNSNKLKLNESIIQSSAALFSDDWQDYIGKADNIKQQCDTFQLSIGQIYGLLKGVAQLDTSAGVFKYKYKAGSVMSADSTPPNINTIPSINSTIKTVLEKYVGNKLFATCGIRKANFYDYYFAASSTFTFSFGAKYKCSPLEGYQMYKLPCNVNLEPGAGTFVDIHKADSISRNYSVVNSNTISFTAYRGGASCTYQMNYSNNCIRTIECKTIKSCDYVIGKNVNPYVHNLKGVWRQKEAYAFNSSRNYENKTYNNSNIRKDGMIENYVPFWNFKSGSGEKGLARNSETGTNKWVSTGQATFYAPHGNGLEEKDALNIYSSQLFGYDNKLVTAQAGNARHKQIAFDNFEDYFMPDALCTDQESHFDFKKGLTFYVTNRNIYNNPNNVVSLRMKVLNSSSNPVAYIAKDTSHTGLYSLCIRATKSHSVVRKLNYSGTSLYSGNDSFYRINDIEKAITPFAPTPGKYVVSAWVYEKFADQNSINTYTNAYLNVKVYTAGTAVVNQNVSASGMIIENWQRIDGVFTIPSGADSIKVTLVNGGSNAAFFDDVRIHPFDAKMASHVYHFVHLKVLAELDDNNYATFYEYDDEGSLVRVKRETEKGIVTVQESRKSIKKKSP